MNMIRIILPQHLRTLAPVGSEVTVEVQGQPTFRSALYAGTIWRTRPAIHTGGAVHFRITSADHVTQQRWPFLRFFGFSWRKHTLLGCCALALAARQAPAATPAVRLQGLDRVYFEHLGGLEDPLKVPPFVAELLPVATPTPSSHGAKVKHEVDALTSVEIRDFSLRFHGVPREIFLRQIVAYTETVRITRLWWALYDGGRRSDVWYFTADPIRSEHKALSNYEIESASESPAGDLELQVRGEMFRPQGAWWVTGKIFSFSRDNEGFLLSRVRNVFGFFHDYDTGGAPPATHVSTEHEVHGRFEILSYDSVPHGVLRACRFRDPLSDENYKFSWVEIEKAAVCITGKPGTKASHRGLDEPSFVERGGRLTK